MSGTADWALASLPNRKRAAKKPRWLMKAEQVEEATRLYLGERLSIYCIAAKMDIGPETIRNTLKHAGVTMRGRAEAQLVRKGRMITEEGGEGSPSAGAGTASLDAGHGLTPAIHQEAA